MRLANLLRHSVIREWLLIAILLSAVSVCALKWDWFYRLDQTSYDNAIGFIERAPQSDIIIVGIEEESLKEIGRFPWPRGIHATLINRLTAEGARVIGLDIILTEPDKRDAKADRALGTAIGDSKRVILPVVKSVADGEVIGEMMPVAEFATAAARLAQIDSKLDADGIVRTAYLRAGLGEPRYANLALAMLLTADPIRWPDERALPGLKDAPRGELSRYWVGDNLYHIPFAGPPGHFKRISVLDLLRGDYAPDTFRGKFVLVGATASGLGDEFPTPVSGQTSAMPGVEIHANILQGLREGIDIRRATATQTGAIAIALLMGVMLAYLWLSPRQSLLLTAVLAATVFLGAGVAFRFAYLWISPVVPILTLLLAYPLWSWRKLEATQRFFDDELQRLELEPVVVPQEAAQLIAPEVSRRMFAPDAIENRIAALQTATQRMRNLNRFVADSLESVPEVVLVTDSSARVLFANSSANRMFAAFYEGDVTPQATTKLEGRDLFELLAMLRHGENRNWREIWTGAYEGSQAVSLEATGPREHECLVQIAPSFSARGARTGTIVTLVDVSPLRESERRRDEALRFLSHDMRSPQASILTLLEMQREEPHLMPVDRLVERIGKYSRRTLNLADDFLRLAKAERAKPQDFVPLDLHELTRDAAEEAWTLGSAKKIDIKVRDEEQDSWVMGDRDLLTRALINLLSNAVKYSPPETVVTLSVTRDAGCWVVAVADQGYGISEADMSKLFTRFTRLRQEGQPEEDGIGLGLVFVKTVIERHHGSVSVSSRVTPGDSGTTFSLTIPATGRPAE